MRVLVIDDDSSVSQIIEVALTKEKIICDVSDLGQDGFEVSSLYDYDLIILDLMLPDTSGYDVLQKLRKNKKPIPVLIISGLTDTENKIKGLGFGADDYLTKPFQIQELIARVKAIIRRSKGHSSDIVQIGDLVVDFDNHITLYGKEVIKLTVKEQAVLEILASKKGAVVAKEQFLDHLYNGMDEPDFKIIDVFICKMRRKLASYTGKNFIHTSWGRGYSLKEPDNENDNKKPKKKQG